MSPSTLRRWLSPLVFLVPLTACESSGSLLPMESTYQASVLPSTIAAREAEAGEIDSERKVILESLGRSVRDQLDASGACELVFICTHNSRRSHMAQLWAQTAADHYAVEGIRTYSGGTEATAFNPRAVASIERAGFRVEVLNPDSQGSDKTTSNPVYAVSGTPLQDPQLCFSKTYGDASNPQGGFIAVMTCSDADEACPFVPGAAARFAIPYVDPKAFDGTEREAAAYDERCGQIAREMLYAFSVVGE